MNELDNKLLEHIEIKNEIQKVEKNFIQYTVDNLEPEIIRRKNEIVELIDAFYEKYMKYDMNNDRYKLEVKGSSSLVISQFFFKPIIPVIGIEPKYNAEKMAIVFDLYKTLTSEINASIGKFIPNKTHFCNFCCITTATYNNYLKSSDENLQNVMLMIDDFLLDASLTSSQNREVDNVTTIFRAKVEQNKQEQPTPQTVVIADSVDINMIQKRLKKLNEIKDAKVIENEPK